MQKNSFLPVILGPTASGKTSAGIELAKLIDGEIISVDSRKVYKGLPIGTATPKGDWRDGAYWVQGIPHHLMGHLEPDKFFTAGDFAQQAEIMIGMIRQRGKIPILVGGTGFYFKALQKGLPKLPNRDPQFRTHLEEIIKTEGLTKLFRELEQLDPVAAQAIGPADPHKIIRALEVSQLTGRPFSSWKTTVSPKSTHQFAVMGIDFPKIFLDKRIEERSARMVKNGMVQETREVLNMGYSKSCPALSSFGYREAVQVIEGRLPERNFLSELVKGTKSYAKRQRTWFRTQVKPIWFECGETSTKEELANKMKDFWERLN